MEIRQSAPEELADDFRSEHRWADQEKAERRIKKLP